MKPVGTHVVMAETFTTGAGFEVAKAALDRGYDVTFMTRDLDRYEATLPSDVRARIDIVRCETKTADQLVPAMRALNERKPISAIIGLQDTGLDILASAAQELGVKFTNADAVKTCRDKFATRELAEQLGLNSPRYFRVRGRDDLEKGAEIVGFPCIIKPTKASGSNFVWMCHDIADLRAKFAKLENIADEAGFGEVILEQFLMGPLMSVEVLAENGNLRVLGFTDRELGPQPDFQERFLSFPTVLPPAARAALEEQATEFLKGVGYDVGFAHMEYILTNVGPVLVEANPRIGGVLLSTAIGIAYQTPIYDVMLDLSLGKAFTLPDSPTRAAALSMIYPETAGKMSHVEGLDFARQYPGVKVVQVTLPKGATVPASPSERKPTVLVLTEAESALLAGQYARVASTAVKIVTTPEPKPVAVEAYTKRVHGCFI